jgi:hypothetical protein
MYLHCREEEDMNHGESGVFQGISVSSSLQSFALGIELVLSSDFARSRSSRRKILPEAL